MMVKGLNGDELAEFQKLISKKSEKEVLY